ncbi:hypothetical protein TNCV_4554471 [Trichonephila clavipes]|nr:hypothetical protein TNCV_4554471 [Trichonephila clavipes]
MSSSLVPLETRHAGGVCTLNLSRLKHPPVGVVWNLGKGVLAQMSSSSLDPGSKLRPLENLNSATTTEDLGVKRIESAKTISDKWSQGVSYAQGEQEAKASRRSSLTWIPIEKATSPTLFFSAA